MNLYVFSSIRTWIAKYFGANWHCTHSLAITPTKDNDNNHISIIIVDCPRFRYDTFINLSLMNDCEIRISVYDLFIIAIS